VDYETLVIELDNTPAQAFDDPLMQAGVEYMVTVPGVTRLEGWDLQAALTPFSESTVQAHLAIPSGAVVTLRTRREGERFASLGMGGHSQKLNRWMINRKIPRAVRQQIPLICVNGQAAAFMVGGEWLVGEYFAVRNDVVRVIYLAYTHNS
jgi:tRNA(Ile)-lysidine synthetase-like protein